MWCANIAELYQHTVPYILFVISFVMKSETLVLEIRSQVVTGKSNIFRLTSSDQIT